MKAKETRCKPADFHFDPEQKAGLCPAGKSPYAHRSDCTIEGYRVIEFQSAKCPVE